MIITCETCFDDLTIEELKSHPCPEKYACGACGESCDIQDGTITEHEGVLEFTHKAGLCPAQDEIEETK
jgi:hypothetical protein